MDTVQEDVIPGSAREKEENLDLEQKIKTNRTEQEKRFPRNTREKEENSDLESKIQQKETEHEDVIPSSIREKEDHSDLEQKIQKKETMQEEVIPRKIREKEEISVLEKKIQKKETPEEEVIPRNIREIEENSDLEEKTPKKETGHEEVIPGNIREKEENSYLEQKIQKKETAQEEVIPKNVREQIKNQIEDWEKKDKMFVCTRASDYVIECLKNENCITLTAPAGVGKSFIIWHTALILQKKGYNIIPVYSPQNISDYYQPGKQTVFILDDICGNFSANQNKILRWRDLLPVVKKIIADKSCKIIVSCRLQVYKDDRFNILLPFKSCECNLISDNLSLTPEEKTNIAKTYIDTSMIDIGDISQASDFFPLLCYLYHEKKSSDVKEFFRNPFGVYKNELDNLSMNGEGGNVSMCSLALCVLFNNQLEEEWFQGKVTDEQRHLIEDLCGTCDFSINTAKDSLVGTFVITQNGIYRAVHDKLFDFLAHYVGHKMIKCLIDHGDSHLVHERCIWLNPPDDKNSNIDFIIEIHDDYLESYIKRFIKDWSLGHIVVVLESSNFRISSFRQRLLQYLINLDNSEQEALANTKYMLICNCCKGYIDMVHWILNNNVDVDQRRFDKTTGLIMACQEGHVDIYIVRLMLQQNPNVDLCDLNGATPLNKACYKGFTIIVNMLLERNPNIHLCTNDGCSPLYMASLRGHTDVVRLLLEKNPNVDQCNKKGRTALNLSCEKGYTAIVNMLLDKNPNVDICDSDGCSPLYKASLNGHTDIVRLLLKKNPNVDLCDSDGCSPLSMASLNGHTDIVRLLLDKNPNVDLCNSDRCSPLYMASRNGHTDVVRLLLDNNPNVDLCDSDGCSPLSVASLNGQTDVVRLLLDTNPNIDLCDNDGHSPLYMASQNGHTDTVRLLLDKNPSVDLCESDGFSPLFMASLNGHTDIVKLLLEKNPNVDQSDNDGATELVNLCRPSDDTSGVELLLRHKPAINNQTLFGGNALYFSVFGEYIEITRLLLKNNANCNVCIHCKQTITDAISKLSSQSLDNFKQNLFDGFLEDTLSNVADYVSKKSVDYSFDVWAGSSPLHIACFLGTIDIVDCLLGHNANINMTKEDGTTPLFYACELGHEDIVRLLLDKGADTDLLRLDRKSALNIATDNGHKSIEAMITKHMKEANNTSK